MKSHKEYYTHHMEEFEEFDRRSCKSIDVLEFLNGKPWDELAHGFVHALRPSSIRVTTGMCTCDARTWRVTVYVDENDIIQSINQEVEVGLPEGVVHGEAMGFALEYGIDSPQCQWYNDDDIEMFLYSADGYFKRTSEGYVPFPEDEKDPFDEANEIID